MAHGHLSTVPTSLLIASMSKHDVHIPQGYLFQALMESLAMASFYLTSTSTITLKYTTALPALIPAPDESHIISHLREDTSSHLTNYVISMSNYRSYAMLATIDTPIKIRLPTTITIASSHHH